MLRTASRAKIFTGSLDILQKGSIDAVKLEQDPASPPHGPRLSDTRVAEWLKRIAIVRIRDGC